ncbi:MAG: excinuclease ABC subunit UvrC [Candidatus Kariarchaeaceae archaeon]|jgi:excinuclease ABC subunit C
MKIVDRLSNLDNDTRLIRIEKQLKALPRKPGVYVILNEKNKIIYVGKAKSLANRVRSHFTPSTDFSKSRVIREKGYNIEVHEVSSESEALLLEYNMIQEHQPLLNERWKDGKTYPYLEVTLGEKFPRFQVTREQNNSESVYIGPFSDVGAVKRSLRYSLQLFPVADCKKEIHLGDAESWAQTCIRRRTRQCMRPCEIAVNPTEYMENVNQVVHFIEGNLPEVVTDLSKKMKESSGKLEFEQAAKYRDLLKYIKRSQQRQNVMIPGIEDTIVISDAQTNSETCIAIQKIKNGSIVRQDAKAIGNTELEDNSWSDFVMSFLLNVLQLNAETINNTGYKVIVQTEPSNEIITSLNQFGFETKPVNTDVDRQLVEMTQQHAKRFLQRRILIRKDRGVPASRVEDLQKILDLDDPPFIIDTFDVSTLMGSNTVASCVRFENGRPFKKGYRRYKIKTVDGQDDFASMEEVVFRRYREVKNNIDPRGLPIPDLIVIDGGAEQLRRAKNSLDQLELDIFIIGLAKREEEIYLFDIEDPIAEDKNRPGLLLLRSCRDEAHRFAITYQKLLRQKTGLESILDNISGIGPKRKKKLISKYRTVSNMAKESSETLSEQVGISRKLASKVISECRKFTTKEGDLLTSR